MALTQTAVWYFNRQIPGLASWAVAYWSALITSLNFLLRTPDAGPFWVLSMQLSQFLVGILIYKGVRDHLGLEPVRIGFGTLAFSTLLASSVYFSVIAPDPGPRILTTSLISALLFTLSGSTLITHQRGRSAARILVAIPCLFHGFFAIARVFLILQQMSGGASFEPANLPPIVVVETITVLVLTSFGTLILANEYVTNELRRLAERDALTGTCNRRTFLTLLGKALSIAQRRQSPLSVLLIDLDHFKNINDTWGHKHGDAALAHFVRIANGCLRNEDILGRLGGEEFAIFLPETSVVGARVVAERLRARVENSPLETENGRIKLTISIGVVQCSPGNESSDEVLHRADSAMYLAKERGRNRVETDEMLAGTA